MRVDQAQGTRVDHDQTIFFGTAVASILASVVLLPVDRTENVAWDVFNGNPSTFHTSIVMLSPSL